MTAPEHIAIYPGSFDPITLGHLDVIRRARRMFDSLIVAIGHNPDKPALFSFSERLEITRKLINEMLEVEPANSPGGSGSAGGGCPVRVEHYKGLTVDFAREVGAVAILRGIRNTSDVANECQIAITNRSVADVETVFIVTGEAYAYTSSSLIKQIAAFGGPVERLKNIVSPLVIERLREKLADPKKPLSRLANDQVPE